MVSIGVSRSREQLFTTAPDASHEVQITHDPWDHEDTTVSPDGKGHLAATTVDAFALPLSTLRSSAGLCLTPKGLR